MTSTTSSRTLPYIQLLFAAILWSLGGVLIKLVEWSPAGIAGIRSLIAALVLFPFIHGDYRPKGLKEFSAAVFYALTLYSFVLATRNTTAANAIVLQYSAPVYVALLSSFVLGEKISLKDLFFIAIALAGMVLFFFDGLSSDGFWGNIYAIFSGVCFGTMIILLRLLKDGNPLRAVVYGNIFVFIASLWSFPNSIPPLNSIYALLVLGVFQIALAYLFFTKAIKKVRAIDGVFIPILEPILNPLWVLLFIGERPGSWAIVGSVLVIGSVTARAVLEAKTVDLIPS